MSGFCAHIICRCDESARKLPLKSEAPFLNVWHRRFGVNRANLGQLIVDVVRIQIVCGEAVSKKEYRFEGGRWNSGIILNQKRRIECHLIFAAKALEEQVVHSIAASNYGLLIWRISNAEARGEILSMYIDERTIPQRAVGCKNE